MPPKQIYQYNVFILVQFMHIVKEIMPTSTSFRYCKKVFPPDIPHT